MAASIVKTLGKVAMVGGALYITAEQGIWSNPQQASDTLQRLTRNLTSHDDYLKQVPSPSQTSSLVKSSWNSGVQTVCTTLADIPNRVGGWSKQMLSSLKGSED